LEMLVFWFVFDLSTSRYKKCGGCSGSGVRRKQGNNLWVLVGNRKKRVVGRVRDWQHDWYGEESKIPWTVSIGGVGKGIGVLTRMGGMGENEKNCQTKQASKRNLVGGGGFA